MDKALNIYISILKNYISVRFDGEQYIDPIVLNKERFMVKAIFIASVLFIKNNPQNKTEDILSETDKWLEKVFSPNNLFSSIIKKSNKHLNQIANEFLSNLDNIQSIDIPILYESLLSIETESINSKTRIVEAKNYRNKLGSYYTPHELAEITTKKTIDSYFKLNYNIDKLSSVKSLNEKIIEEIKKTTFVDFSCGGGAFIAEIINYFTLITKNIGCDIEESKSIIIDVSKKISAFDVDCLALEVAKLNLLLNISHTNGYDEISQNFTHGNFLLQTDSNIEKKQKIDVFASGFINHESLSVNKNDIKTYDIILGNPPWEKIRFEEKKFYALYTSDISNNYFKATRKDKITELSENNVPLAIFSKDFQYEIEKTKKNLKESSFFNLSSNGELNTYALFTEAAMKLRNNRGVAGLILKSAIITSQVNRKLFNSLCEGKMILSIYDFINKKKIFDIDSRERFCFLIIGNTHLEGFNIAMNLTDIREIESSNMDINLAYKSLKSLNPLTGMLPNFTSKEDANFLLKISNNFSFFKDIYKDVSFGRIVHLTNHSEYISKKKEKNNIPIYEGKFFNQYDGKYSGFNGLPDAKKYGSKASSILLDKTKKKDNNYFPESRFFIDKSKWLQLSKNYDSRFMLAWRSLTSATNTRTCISTILPFIPASQSVQFLITKKEEDLIILCALFNSVVFDYILKKKLSGIDLTQSVINQIPVPKPIQYENIVTINNVEASIKTHIISLVYSLLKDDSRLTPLFKELNIHLLANSISKDAIRYIDLIFMSLYDINMKEIELISSEFSKQYSNEDIEWFKNQMLLITK
ncbi:Eco57I restriction-modification methylase domain-containing protein [Bacteroides sp.]